MFVYHLRPPEVLPRSTARQRGLDPKTRSPKQVQLSVMSAVCVHALRLHSSSAYSLSLDTH